jgi:DNA-directed RNA polymerase subunit RPC12/RpoP
MADVVSSQCKLCGKEFKLRPDQVGREVRCPYCKAICKILPRTETAREAAEALRGEVPEHRTVTTHRHVVMPRGGVRHRSVAVVWVVLIGLAAIGLVVLLVVMARRPQPTAPAPGTGAVGAAGTPATATPGAPAVAPTPEAVNLEIEKLVQGTQNGNRTYAVGTITNQTRAMIQEVEVRVGIFDAQEQELGRAEARVRDLKPGEKAPVVAVWEHDPAVRGVEWVPNYDIPTTPPAGPPTNLAIASVPWFQPDAGSSVGTGKIVTDVKNQGAQAVNAVEMTAVMRGADGQVIGAARDVVRVTIMPGETKPVEIRYERCPDYLRGPPIQVRVQAAGP